MAETVFILGAGASKESDAPLMNEFRDATLELHRASKTEGYDTDFDTVFKAISYLQPVIESSRSVSSDTTC